MNDFNFFALTGLLIRVTAIIYIAFWIVPKQWEEIGRPKDWLSGLRWRILALLLFTISMAAPSVSYQYSRLDQPATNMLQNVSSITGNLSYFGLAVLFGLIYNYRKKQ